MVAIRSNEFTKKSIDQLLTSYFVFIFYGSDKGLIFELVNQFKKRIGVLHHDQFYFVVLNALDIQENPEILWNEVKSISLFNEKKIILIENLSAEKKVLTCLEEIISKNINNNLIIITSNEPKKYNILRKIAEKFTSVLSISCYPDSPIDLINLIKEELCLDQKQISIEGKQALFENLGGDRIASRIELQKLASYCLEDILITEKHVKDIICDTHILYIEEIIETTMQGDTYNAIIMAEFFFGSKMSPHALLNGFLQKFQLLEKIYIESEFLEISIEKTIQKFEKTRIPKKRLLLQKFLQIWNKNIIKKILHKINQEIHLLRKKRSLEKSIIFQIILLISQTAHKIQKR
ncbi:MAG: DNA polymerase III subunit delta [Candidatus Liberibacter psyllaurous]